MRIVVTGGAGFIGSNISDYFISKGHEVTVVDNLSSGFERRVPSKATLVKADLTESSPENWESAFRKVDLVIHFAANVDNRYSWSQPYSAIENNIVATMNVALASARNKVPRIIYASTGTAYGDHPYPPYKEKDASSEQTTLYGATKYAGEGLLSVFAHHYGIAVDVFRFVGVLGPGYSHGHVFDFVGKLLDNPRTLDVLGDGWQKKSYVHVQDLCEAINIAMKKTGEPELFRVFNLGRRDFSNVRDSVNWILDELGIAAEVEYGDSQIGWVGDNPKLYLDPSKLEALGWTPRRTIENSVRETARWLVENKWIFDK